MRPTSAKREAIDDRACEAQPPRAGVLTGERQTIDPPEDRADERRRIELDRDPDALPAIRRYHGVDEVEMLGGVDHEGDLAAARRRKPVP